MHRFLTTIIVLIAAGCAKQYSRDSLPRPEPRPVPMETPGTQLERIEVTGSRIHRHDEERFVDIQVLRSDEPDAMFFEHYGVNPTIDTEEESLSTFSVDVDRASYSLTRAYLERGQLPPEKAVRVEEFINAMNYHYQAPDAEDFTISAEAFPSPNRPGYHVLHIGLRARDVHPVERKPMNLVFVVDTSGSMARDDRLGEVKRFLRRLANQMRRGDSIGIVEYGTDAQVVLRPTFSSDLHEIHAAISRLSASGSTNAADGVALGYDMISRHFNRDHTNRIFLCSDGVANVGPATDPEGILDRIGQRARDGVYLSTIGFGMGNYNDVLMEQLAQHGGGNYYYVDTPEESERLLGDEMMSTLETVAEDVRIQVQFDPRTVDRFRLIGYENRDMDHSVFDNDRGDSGEVGSGHTVTALYEIKLRDHENDMGWLRLRYHKPGNARSNLIERPLAREIIRDRIEFASPPSQLALVASMLAEKLRGSYWVRHVDYADMAGLFDRLPASLRTDGSAKELREIITLAHRIDDRADKFGTLVSNDFDRVPVLR